MEEDLDRAETGQKWDQHDGEQSNCPVAKRKHQSQPGDCRAEDAES